MKTKNIQKNLMIQPETSNRLKEISEGLNLSQSFLVQYLIDDYYINSFQYRDEGQPLFSLFESK